MKPTFMQAFSSARTMGTDGACGGDLKPLGTAVGLKHTCVQAFSTAETLGMDGACAGMDGATVGARVGGALKPIG